MTNELQKRIERIAAGLPFDGQQAIQAWLATLTPEDRAIAEAFYRRLAQRARAIGLI